MRSVGASLHGCRAPGSRGTRDGPQHHGWAGREPAFDPSQPMSPACALWTTSLHVSQELEELWAAPQTHGRNPICAALHGTLRTPAWGAELTPVEALSLSPCRPPSLSSVAGAQRPRGQPPACLGETFVPNHRATEGVEGHRAEAVSLRAESPTAVHPLSRRLGKSRAF